jgi:hypothetical protein
MLQKAQSKQQPRLASNDPALMPRTVVCVPLRAGLGGGDHRVGIAGIEGDDSNPVAVALEIGHDVAQTQVFLAFEANQQRVEWLGHGGFRNLNAARPRAPRPGPGRAEPG